MLPWVWVTVCWARRTFPLRLFGCQLTHTRTNDLACALSCNLITDRSAQASFLCISYWSSDLHNIPQIQICLLLRGCREQSHVTPKADNVDTIKCRRNLITHPQKHAEVAEDERTGSRWIQSASTLLFALTKHKTPAICQVNKKHLMFDESELLVWRHTARRESEAGRASYASQRKLDKRIILIALAQRFPSSRSTWWSARSPPCYSPCASQVSTCMSVFISQVALAWLFFPPSLLFFLLAVSRCEWDGADLSLLSCLSVNCSDNQMNSGNAKTHTLKWLSMLFACNYVLCHICRDILHRV